MFCSVPVVLYIPEDLVPVGATSDGSSLETGDQIPLGLHK